MKTIAISIDEDILSRIDKLAGNGEGAVNRSKVIREAVREYLSRAERVAEDVREGEIIRRHRTQLRRQAVALVKEQAKP